LIGGVTISFMGHPICKIGLGRRLMAPKGPVIYSGKPREIKTGDALDSRQLGILPAGSSMCALREPLAD
jgi:hypothetical protein